MKRMDWLIAGIFIVMGMSCFVMSMSFVDHSASVHEFFMTTMNYCIWIGVPLIVAGFLYLTIRRRKRK